jgi:hypothetical protein
MASFLQCQQLRLRLANMTPRVPPRISLCCWRTLLGDASQNPLQRRSLVTVQRGPVQKLEIPPNIPAQYWSQLPARLRPDKGEFITVYAMAKAEIAQGNGKSSFTTLLLPKEMHAKIQSKSSTTSPSHFWTRQELDRSSSIQGMLIERNQATFS